LAWVTCPIVGIDFGWNVFLLLLESSRYQMKGMDTGQV
jgi:hypothetical protein